MSYFRQALAKHAQIKAEQLLKNPISVSENEDLFDKQRDFINDPSRFKVAVCSRRAGKTSAIARKLRKVATGGWEHNALYVAKTTDACKRILWNLLMQVIAKYHRPNEYKTNVSELSVYFKATNAFIWLKGANDSQQIQKLLGVKLKFLCIDEAQSFPAYLEYFIDEILAPSLTDLQGELAVCGTPNPMSSGYFYEISQRDTWKQFHWTIADNTFYLQSAMRENPQISSVMDIISAEAKRKGVPITHPSIQRDYFGLWVKSDELQVYKYTAAKQDFDELPNEAWQVVLGIDIGFQDHDAVIALGYSALLKQCYVLEEYKQNQTDITTLAGVIKRFVAKYNPYVCVVDAGALGLKIAAELSTRHGLSLTAAEKSRKAEFIELMNDDLRNGRLKIRARSKLAQEMNVLCWDEDYFKEGKYVENPDHQQHCCDAALYAWRWSYHYLFKDKTEKPMSYEDKDELKLLAKFQRDRLIKDGNLW